VDLKREKDSTCRVSLDHWNSLNVLLRAQRTYFELVCRPELRSGRKHSQVEQRLRELSFAVGTTAELIDLALPRHCQLYPNNAPRVRNSKRPGATAPATILPHLLSFSLPSTTTTVMFSRRSSLILFISLCSSSQVLAQSVSCFASIRARRILNLGGGHDHRPLRVPQIRFGWSSITTSKSALVSFCRKSVNHATVSAHHHRRRRKLIYVLFCRWKPADITSAQPRIRLFTSAKRLLLQYRRI
jgi:hypothetical protein